MENRELTVTTDTLFTNGVGRPDLKADSEESKVKAKLLYHSLLKKISKVIFQK